MTGILRRPVLGWPAVEKVSSALWATIEREREREREKEKTLCVTTLFMYTFDVCFNASWHGQTK